MSDRIYIEQDSYTTIKNNYERESASKQISEKRKEVNYDTRDYPIKYLAEEFLNDKFFIPSEYQRQFVWGSEDKSSLIESILMGLPLPFMFFADADDGRIEIVDGAQRTQTMTAFVQNDLELEDLTVLTSLNGFQVCRSRGTITK